MIHGPRLCRPRVAAPVDAESRVVRLWFRVVVASSAVHFNSNAGRGSGNIFVGFSSLAI